MQAVIGQDCRPNCLVIDEIDGAPTPAINHLISQIKAGEGESKSDEGGKKKKKKQPLLRPIICICNDQ
jgi:chromosome transmission fidelity protein 18